ncbi:alcohol dehydrogenase [Halobacteriales archaeon QS_4_70_19]|nr:MAG: alcohol dehydrogenase [Halobacteriales archaeon QS_4_70_19]
MKAVYYEEHGNTDVIQHDELPDPEFDRDQCLVEMKAGGLNHLDVWTRRGMPSPGEFPHIPGSDGAGIVREVGEDVTRFEAGDRVAVAPATSCGECEFCRDGDRSLCENFQLIGEHTTGVHSELTALAEDNLVHVPDHVDFVTAAAAPLVFQTAWRMLTTRAEVRQGENVLVHGASGGVGHAAVQIAANAGAEVWATASTDAKLDLAAECGADHLINYDEEDFVSAIKSDTDGRGADVVVDHIGAATWQDSISACTQGARLVTCGATTGPNPETDVTQIFWKQLDILGSTMGTPGEMDDVLSLVWDGTFTPYVREVLPMSETARAHQMLQDREGFGSVVVIPNDEYEEGAYQDVTGGI